MKVVGIPERVCVCANLNFFFFCSVRHRPAQTARADSCLDWAGASGPLASPQQRQVRAFSWLSSHFPLTGRQHTTVNPSPLSQSKLGFPLQSRGNRETFWLLFVYYFAFIKKKVTRRSIECPQLLAVRKEKLQEKKKVSFLPVGCPGLLLQNSDQLTSS